MRFSRALSLFLYPACIAAVAILSLIPNPDIGISFRFMDKVEHLAAYLALGALGTAFFIALGRRPFTAAVASLAASFAVGALVECIQPLTGRHFELMDLASDFAGAAAGAFLVALAVSRARASVRNRA
jgi:VanZ family protein